MKFGHWLTLLGTAAALTLLWSLRDVLIHVFAAIVLAMALCSSGALGLSTVTVMPIVVAATFDAKLNNTKLTSFGDLAVSAAIPAASKCAAGGPALPSARS